jgi:hypothetical protein
LRDAGSDQPAGRCRPDEDAYPQALAHVPHPAALFDFHICISLHGGVEEVCESEDGFGALESCDEALFVVVVDSDDGHVWELVELLGGGAGGVSGAGSYAESAVRRERSSNLLSCI